MTANTAITLSRKMMNGNKWKFFCLSLSFIGWMLLGILTLGIGFLFLNPYMQASKVAFFEDAYNNYVSEHGDEIEIKIEQPKQDINADKTAQPETEIVVE